MGYPGGHHTEVALLTGVAPEGVRFNDIRNTISLDQEVAARLGGETRLPCLVLGGGVAVVESQGREGAVGGAGHPGLQAALHRRHPGGSGAARSSGSRPARASSTACATVAVAGRDARPGGPRNGST